MVLAEKRHEYGVWLQRKRLKIYSERNKVKRVVHDVKMSVDEIE